VFPVNSAELIARMEWQCLTTKNIAALRPSSAMNEFLLFGYPDCRVKVTGVQVAINPLLLRTSRYFGSVRIKKTHPLVDLFLAYGDNATDSNGREVQAPPLGGISGTPVWAVERTNSGVWSPESSLHVVGVNSSCVSRRGSKIYLIAKQWAAIWKVFERIDAEVAMEIHQALYL